VSLAGILTEICEGKNNLNLNMTDVLKLGKRIFTIGVVVTTIMWSLGVVSLASTVANAASCPTLSAGNMIKVTGKAAIYAVNNASKVLYFPSGDEFKSWNVNNTYGGYISVTQECFDSLSVPSTYPGGVNYRPGSYVVKRPSSDQLYVVEPGNTLAKISVTDAKALYGATYKVMTVADPFWPHYVNRGADIAGLAHEGMLVSKDSKTWYVAAGNVLREVTATGMTANRFKTAFVHAVPAAYLAGFTTGAVLDSLDSTISNRTQDGAIAPGTGGNLTVALAADNPAAANIADGSAYNAVLKLALSAGSATKVTGITLTKTGLIANTNITGVSIWDAEGNRHGDVMTSFTSDNKVTVGFAGNPILVSSGAPESLIVRLNISAAANSGLVGMKVAAATDITSDGTVGGSFPITGNQMSIIDGNASLAIVSSTNVAVGGITNGSEATIALANISVGDVGKEIAKFKFTESSGNEDVVISRLTFYFEGSLQDKDLTNLSLVAPDGSVLGTATTLADRYVTINFTNPYTLPKSTNRTLTLKADVVDGSTHYFRVHLQNDYDMLLKGSTTGFYILPDGFADQYETNGWFEIKSGSLTVNKNVASPAGNISSGASGVVLATFDIKAVGENMEIRKMGLGVVTTTASTHKLTGNISVQDSSGNTYLTVAASDVNLYYPTQGKQYNMSSYLTINSGSTKTLQVVGNIDSLASGDTYKIAVGDFYAKRLSTLDFKDNLPTVVPTSTAANQLAVSATALTCYKDTAMGNVTRASGSNTVLGQYICTAGTSEDIALSSMTFAFGDTGSAANTFQNVALYDGTTQLGSTLSTVASTSNGYTFSLTVPKGTTKTLQLQGLIISGASGVVSSSISAYNYTGKSSNNSTSYTTPLIVGQNVTVGNGTLGIAAASDASTISKIYGPSQTGVQLGKWKLSAASDSVTLNKLSFTLRLPDGAPIIDYTTSGLFGLLTLYDSTGAALATGNYVAGNVVFTGLTLEIPMDSYKVITLKGNTNGSGVINKDQPVDFVIKSNSNTDMEARSGAGSLLAAADIGLTTAGSNSAMERFATSSAYIFHDAYPTITATSLGSALALDTKAQILKFTVTNSGARDLRVGSTTISVSVSGLAGAGTSSGTIRDFRLYEDNGSGGLGTYLAVNDTVVNSSTANPSTVTFDGAQAATTGSMSNITIGPGAAITFIVTADTSNMGTSKTSGTSVTLSAKIAGSTGWSGSAWNTGNLFYYYTPVGGSENTVPYSASDSYEVSGSTMTRAF